jgi:hypothetical protein
MQIHEPLAKATRKARLSARAEALRFAAGWFSITLADYATKGR